MSVAEQLSQEEVVRRLERYDIVKNRKLARLFPPGQYPHTRRCAILVPLFFHPHDGQLHVLLTQRSSTLSSHASQVAFPGGAQDPTDADDTHTALREAHEEVGLAPSDVTVVAHLPPSFVRNNNSVFPVVGFIPPDFKPRPDPREVARVFSLPLKTFTTAQLNFNVFSFKESKFLSPSLTVEVGEGRSPVVVWGFTCWLCLLVARAVLEPFKRLRLLAGDVELAARKKESEGGSGHDVDLDACDDNVFGDWVNYYHAFCEATRLNSRL